MNALSRWLGRFGSKPVPEPKAQITTSAEIAEVLMAMQCDTRSGVSISPESAMAVTAVAAAVGLLAETVAQIPIKVERIGERGPEPAPEHFLSGIFSTAGEPNDWQNTFEFRETLQLHLACYGNAYCFRNEVQGRLVELLPLHPTRVSVDQKPDYSIVYRVQLIDGTTRQFERRQVFHLRDRSFGGVVGQSRVQTSREAIGLSQRMEHYASNFFGNSARPSGVLVTDQSLKPEDIKKIAESWRDAYGGDNAHGTAVLDGGFTFNPLNMTSADAQFNELRRHQVAEIARIFRVPSHMINDLERATFNNIAELSIQFVRYSLMPWLGRWEACIAHQLLPKEDRGKFQVKFEPEGLMRGTAKDRAEYYSSMVQNKLMTRNEVRIREGLATVDGGDVFENPAITVEKNDAPETE